MVHLYVTAKTTISFWVFSTGTHTGPGSRALIDLPTTSLEPVLAPYLISTKLSYLG